jgi:translation elongation factor EF-Ts
MLTDYISALFVNTKNDLSDNSVILFFAYWKTTIEIGNLLNINCEKIFIDNKDTNYKYFDYSSLIGQLLSTTLTENTQKYFVRTIENMIKSCVYNADCNIADYLTYITYLIEFFEFICKNNVVISELTSMESNNSVISCECINLVKNIINNNNKAKYAPQKIINNYIKKTIPDYDINKIISVMDNNWLVKDTFGENPHVNEPSINNELSQQIENV